MAGYTAFLTEQKYNEVLQRHGQFVRWQQGITCNCINEMGQVNPRCELCQGRGRIYKYQKSVRWDNEYSRHNREIVGVNHSPIRKVHAVTRQGYPYTVDSVGTDTLQISVPAGSPLRLPYPHERIIVDYEQDMIVDKTITDVTVYAENIIKLNGLQYEITRDDQIKRSFPMDLVEITSVKDTTDNITLTVQEYGRDKVIIEASRTEFTITAINRTVVPYSIEVSGDARPYIHASNKIEIINHSLSNGEYTVTGVTYSTGTDKTTIEISEQPPDDTVEGKVKAPEYEIDSGHDFEIICKVVIPWKFLVTSISEKMKYEDAYIGESGEAQLTVPYNIHVGTGDMVTLLAAEKRGETILKYDATENIYELAALEIKEILQIIDSTGDNEFIEETDYILIQADKLKFLAAGKKPNGTFTVVFMYHPVFSILDDIPMVRTGESKRFPRKVMLKTLTKTNAEFDPFKRT